MSIKRIICATMLCTLLTGGCVVDVGPPPPPRVEVIPAPPYQGAVWVHGYWYRGGGGWVWAHGYYR